MTLGEIIGDHIIPTLVGSDLDLHEATEAFTFRRQPAGMVDRSFYVTDEGVISSRSMGAHRAARIDAVGISVALRAAINASVPRRIMWDILVDVERALIADGEAQGYHVSVIGREVKRAAGREYIVGTLRISVDYDFAESATA